MYPVNTNTEYENKSLNINGNFISVEQVFMNLPKVFTPYLKKITTDKKAISVIYLLYLHIIDERNRYNTLQELADKLAISRNTLIRIFYLLEEIGLFERHYIVENKYEGNSFNKETVIALDLDIASGKHIFIFSTIYNDINDWLNTPDYIKELYIKATTLSFYRFTNQLIVQLRKHPLNRYYFFKHPNTLVTALNLLVHHSVIKKDLKPCGRSFVHRYKLTPIARDAIAKEMAEKSNPNILQRGDWQQRKE